MGDCQLRLNLSRQGLENTGSTALLSTDADASMKVSVAMLGHEQE